MDVVFDGGRRDFERECDFLIGQTFDDKMRNLSLARSQGGQIKPGFVGLHRDEWGTNQTACFKINFETGSRASNRCETGDHVGRYWARRVFLQLGDCVR